MWREPRPTGKPRMRRRFSSKPSQLFVTKMADSNEVYDLLQNKIPVARQQLRDSHKNLGDLASYCERNYIDSGQTTAALEETKRYAAQSLASVAYQVNVLAVSMLELLDKQMKNLGDMEANIHHISQARDS